MPLNLASPGVLVREVDLTVGRIDPVSPSVGAIAAPFAQGPVGEPTLIQNENDLLNTFGKPYSADKHYEYWMVSSSYLAYGGSLQVVRTDDTALKNAAVGTNPKIKSVEHYEELGYAESTLSGTVVAAKNPGSWANGIRVAIIDARADQILTGITTSAGTTTTFDTSGGVADVSGTLVGSATTILFSNTTGIEVGDEVRSDISGVVAAGTTVLAVPGGGAAGIVTVSSASLQSSNITTTFDFGVTSTTTTSNAVVVGMAVTQPLTGKYNTADGTQIDLSGSYLKGLVTEVGDGQVSVKVLSRIDAAGTEVDADYDRGTLRFTATGSLGISDSSGRITAQGVEENARSYTAEKDWFDSQSITLSKGTLDWNALATRPGTSEFASERNARFDEVHVVVIDDRGEVTGNAGTVLEKHLALSKAKDANFSSGSPSYWRTFLQSSSNYIFGLGAPSTTLATGFAAGTTTILSQSSYDWDKDAKDIVFNTVGNYHNLLTGGLNYDGQDDITNSGALASTVAELKTAYNVFTNEENTEIDFLLMGSAAHSQDDSRDLAANLIAIAESRQDTLAFISPYRAALMTDTSVQSEVTIKDIDTITTNVIDFFAPITSSTYGIFDSGYKYMYDRFNNTFRYVPLNGDIAGTCARNDINNFPWFSPAGTARGTILNAVKLAYNPGKLQRDKLYSNRINPVILSPGAGIVLFGDKTAYGKSSAFDRINVRRLFVYLEDAISAAARDQLFEFNDELTRTNFVNIVEPFLRDVQSKRGIYDFVVICDQTNNTSAVIDNNEFVADIYIKPAKSINFIGLTFVATRTGVSFEEVIGNV